MKWNPSPDEQMVASALLLLSKTIPNHHQSPSVNNSEGIMKPLKLKQREIDESVSKSHSVSASSSSTVTMSDASTSSFNNRAASQSHRLSNKLRIVTVVSRHRSMKFKVVRKKRSEVSHEKSKETTSFNSSTTTEESVSCISTEASTPYLKLTRGGSRNEKQQKKRRNSSSTSSNKMSRLAEAILKMLSSSGSSSEVQIRQVLGDSPDTSKALRMLLKQEDVIRSGTGGRSDPYIYQVA